jgi:hypothetical protein
MQKRVRLTYPAKGPAGESLELSLSLPADWSPFEVGADAPPKRAQPGAVSAALSDISRAMTEAGGIVVTGIRSGIGAAAGAPSRILYATLSAALADVGGDPPDGTPGAVRVDLPAGPGVRVRKVAAVKALDGVPAAPVLTERYLLRTGHGALALTFATPQVEFAREHVEAFGKVAWSCTITRVP